MLVIMAESVNVLLNSLILNNSNHNIDNTS